MKDLIKIFAANTTGHKVNTVGNNSTDKNLTGNVQSIINGVILVLGTVAVIIIIMGGIQYMTSSGDSGKVKKAKDTILYGVIGLIICVLAFAIVNFVVVNLLGNS